jgi:hypothetical protein
VLSEALSEVLSESLKSERNQKKEGKGGKWVRKGSPPKESMPGLERTKNAPGRSVL